MPLFLVSAFRKTEQRQRRGLTIGYGWCQKHPSMQQSSRPHLDHSQGQTTLEDGDDGNQPESTFANQAWLESNNSEFRPGNSSIQCLRAPIRACSATRFWDSEVFQVVFSKCCSTTPGRLPDENPTPPRFGNRLLQYDAICPIK